MLNYSFKINILLITAICCYSGIPAQTKYHYDFEKLNIIDSIRSQRKIDSLKQDNMDLVLENVFCGTLNVGVNEKAKVVVFKKADYWLVADLGIYDNNISCSLVNFTARYQYLYIKSEHDHSARQTEFNYKDLYCVDLTGEQFFKVSFYDYMYYYKPSIITDFEFKKQDFRLISSQITINGDCLTVMRTCFNNFDDDFTNSDVIASGEYKIHGRKLIKTKYYDEETMQLKSIHYLGDIADGMTIDEVRALHPHVNFVEAENSYGSCADNNKIGFEIREGRVLLGFSAAALSDGKIENLVSLSPVYYFGKIHVTSSLSEILKAFPEVKSRLDLLTDWEHIFIEKLNIELVFKTTGNDRIAVYHDEQFVKWKNKKARVDFIMLFK